MHKGCYRSASAVGSLLIALFQACNVSAEPVSPPVENTLTSVTFGESFNSEAAVVSALDRKRCLYDARTNTLTMTYQAMDLQREIPMEPRI